MPAKIHPKLNNFLKMQDNIQIKEEIKKRTFEECLPIIDALLQKRKYRWQLTGLTWIGWDDVAQILRIHVFNKWELYDQSQKIEPWLNKIFSSQMINLARNNFYRFSKPCLKCAFSENSDESCGFTKEGVQNESCPIYAKWLAKKKSAHDINLPVTLESHSQEVNALPHEHFDLEYAILNFHEKMKQALNKTEYKIYDLLYIQKLSEAEAAKQMGYKSHEASKVVGYNNFLRFKKRIMEKARKVKDEIDFIKT